MVKEVKERLRLSYLNYSPSPYQGEGDTGDEVTSKIYGMLVGLGGRIGIIYSL